MAKNYIYSFYFVSPLSLVVITPGGGAIEMCLSKFLRDHSRSIAGKEQLIIAAVAKALEVIPRQLCDNAGFDSTNVLNRLRQMHAQGQTASQRPLFLDHTCVYGGS